MSAAKTTATATAVAPKIILYTNHLCPWAHRAHIALKALELPYEEVIIDLSKPREEWYLKEINPRGLVPAIKFSNGVIQDEVITESGIVAQFLADIRPPQLLPPSFSSPTAALFRARVSFFVDTFVSKVWSLAFSAVRTSDAAEKEQISARIFEAVSKEIEPLLKDAAPFFGGSDKLTLAEVQTGSLLLRVLAFSNDDILPAALKTSLNNLPNFGKWSKATVAQEAVNYIWNPDLVLTNMKKKFAPAQK
ncbi:thioredoxin-like protein [Xylona heveae TC161]|uniref:Thioredoxin-like protein n=1 Tax=Xylona heveae (strain CBS 132557 / TC161) TaxID=1328760 RepID=A0A165IPG7_XYLHT|nr:thioredoxin-like protein [Xylona heveae TC161]KZF25190.1 thioredoxin-like protein [Xylona heveae TC161]